MGAASDMLRHHREQPVRTHRLREVTDRAEFLAAVITFLHRGEKDHRDVREGLVGLQRRDELEAIHVRHVDVRDDQVGRATEDHVPGRDGVLCNQHLVAGCTEMQPQQVAGACFVVHYEDGGSHDFLVLVARLERATY